MDSNGGSALPIGQVSTEQLIQLLATIDYDVLSSFAAAHGISVPSGMDLEELARLVLKSVPNLGPSVRQVVRLELKHTEASIKAQIQQVLIDVSAATDKKIAVGLSEVSILKYVFSTIAAAISLIMAVGGVFGLFQFARLWDLQKKLDDDLANRKALTKAQKAYTVSRAMDSVDGLLTRVSLSLVEPGDMREAQHVHSLLSDLPAEHEDAEVSESDQMIALLGGVTNDLIALRDVTTAVGAAAVIAALDKAEPQWRQAPLSSPMKDETFTFFVTTLSAHRHNVLGILELKRYRVTKTGSALDAAESEFLAAKGLNPNLSRIYSNLGVAKLLNLEALAGAPVRDRGAMLKLALDSRRDFEDALSHSDDPHSQSLTLNNLAVTFLREADLIEQPSAAIATLSKGFRYLEQAKALPGRDWAIFETWAQLLAARFVRELKANATHPSGVQEVVSLIALAAAESGNCQGYVEGVRNLKEFSTPEILGAGLSLRSVCQ